MDLTLEQLKKDLDELRGQSIAINGAIQYITQKIVQLEKKEKEEQESGDKEKS